MEGEVSMLFVAWPFVYVHAFVHAFDVLNGLPR